MDKGMKKVVNLVTNYTSALCETGRVPGRVDRNIEAGTAVYFPGGGAAKATAYKAWEPDYAFEADNRRTLEAFCTAFGIEVTEYVYNSYCHSFRWRAKNEGDEEITDNEYIRHCLSLFEPTGFYLDEVILGPAKQPTEGKVFGNVIEECLEAFFSACCEDVKYTQSQEYFADFAENNELEFYENGICIRHR